MFYMLPPIINLFVLFLPVMCFRLYDWHAYYTHDSYKACRERFGSYWAYRTAGPRHPPWALYGVQLVWAVIFLIPLG